jgi:hypothetical protein
MAHEEFDPIAVEAEMVKIGILPPRADPLPSQLPSLERHFTENDLRKYALWNLNDSSIPASGLAAADQ